VVKIGARCSKACTETTPFVCSVRFDELPDRPVHTSDFLLRFFPLAGCERVSQSQMCWWWYVLGTFVINPLVHISQKEKIAAKNRSCQRASSIAFVDVFCTKLFSSFLSANLIYLINIDKEVCCLSVFQHISLVIKKPYFLTSFLTFSILHLYFGDVRPVDWGHPELLNASAIFLPAIKCIFGNLRKIYSTYQHTMFVHQHTMIQTCWLNYVRMSELYFQLGIAFS
jgi:hypothetical protein